MPEAAEVASQAIFLQKWENKVIVEIAWDEKSKFFKKPIQEWEILNFPLKIDQIFSRGKIIVFSLSNSNKSKFYLTSHLGMTGYYSEQPGKHSNFWFKFQDKTKLFFHDTRHFGNFTVSRDLKKIWEKNGPCILTSALVKYGKVLPEKLNEHQRLINRKKWHEAFRVTSRQKQTKICDFLLEQKRFSGLGNYLRCEIMYYSKIHPNKTVISLSKDEVDRLYEITMKIVYISYKYKGPVSGYHEDGSMDMAVYGKDKDPHGYPVKTFQSKTRTVHFCPKIQTM
jgi:formamidopyrimidine-DNA glycosylase